MMLINLNYICTRKSNYTESQIVCRLRLVRANGRTNAVNMQSRSISSGSSDIYSCCERPRFVTKAVKWIYREVGEVENITETIYKKKITEENPDSWPSVVISYSICFSNTLWSCTREYSSYAPSCVVRQVTRP